MTSPLLHTQAALPISQNASVCRKYHSPQLPVLKLLLLPTLQLQQNTSQTGHHPKKSNCPLIHLRTDHYLRHIGASQRRHEISNKIDELYRYKFSVLINFVNPLQKLNRSQLFQLLLQVGLLLETFPQLQRKRKYLPYNAQQKNRIGNTPNDTVWLVTYHHHNHRSVVEQQKQRDETVTFVLWHLPSN